MEIFFWPVTEVAIDRALGLCTAAVGLSRPAGENCRALITSKDRALWGKIIFLNVLLLGRAPMLRSASSL